MEQMISKMESMKTDEHIQMMKKRELLQNAESVKSCYIVKEKELFKNISKNQN